MIYAIIRLKVEEEMQVKTREEGNCWLCRLVVWKGEGEKGLRVVAVETNDSAEFIPSAPLLM